MNDTDKKESNGNGSPQVGALLRASRLRVGADLREIADILRIRYLYLEAIEDCRYSDLPGSTYAVGFIRSYAEHLGLDGEEVVRRFKIEQTGAKRSNDLSFPTPVPESGMPKGAIVFIGVLLALLVYGGWYVSTTDENLFNNLISPVPDHLKHLVTGDDAAKSASGVAAPAGTSAEATQTETAPGPDAKAEEAMREAAVAATAQNGEPAGETPVEKPAEMPAQAVTEPAPKPMAETPVHTPAPAPAPVAAAAPVVEKPKAPAADKPVEKPKAPVVEKPADKPAPVAVAKPVEPAPAPKPAETAAAPAESPAAPPPSTPKPAAPEVATAEPAVTPAPADTNETATPPPEAISSAAAPAASEPTAEELNALALKQVNGATVRRPEPVAVPSSAPASGVVIRATESSWVEIRNPADGRILFTGLLNTGQTFNVPKIAGLTLDTGNAGGLDITVEGVSAPKLGNIGSVRKGVVLDSARLLAGTAAGR